MRRRVSDGEVRRLLALGEAQLSDSGRFALAMRGLGALEILAAIIIGIGAVRGATASGGGDELVQATNFAGAQLSALVAAALLLAGIYTVKSPRAGLLAQALVGVLLAVVVPLLRVQ